MRLFRGSDDFSSSIGSDLGASEWHLLDQRLFDRFADVTGDRQWIHTDPIRAATSDFGGTVAHGFLIVALLPALLDEIFRVDGVNLVINRGLRRVSFSAPVAAGKSIRARASLQSARPRPRGFTEAVLSVGIEVASEPDPCATIELVLLYAWGAPEPSSPG